ncbi:glycosyltransferase family 1 protein [Heyndrickxia acidicola]|uniref:Glycosyltransferase family 1 protein n=1 Tax=Heyndrickxia acidicola TaxID=209389 RepID=A0ABU6MKH8_9BACI|nr:glycosyltransferase family 1 protein [Heyndrickxia acidicola]MED1205196.1 glycosyltransferase family 1 protein [Heyndrickxia acidicola]
MSEKAAQPKRILHVVSKMDRGGAETLLMNVYRNLDKTKHQFDFIAHTNAAGDFDEEIQSLGGYVHKIKSLGSQGPVKYIKALMDIMKNNRYIAVHSHTDYQNGFPALAAWLSGINNRISHSHSSNWPESSGFQYPLTLKVLQVMIKLSATKLCSCSNEAGVFLYGEKAVNRSKVEIIENGINIEDFLSVENKRQELIQECNLPENAKIIGHVGRLSPSKNHIFILKVLKHLVKQDSSFVGLLVGDGPLRAKIEKEAKLLGLTENIRFLGVRSDIPRLMKAFDVLLFPSLFEGFGMVTIEAQCAGTPCVASKEVPAKTDIGLGLMTFLDLSDDVSVWAFQIKKAMKVTEPTIQTIQSYFQKSNYCIQDNMTKWLSLY